MEEGEKRLWEREGEEREKRGRMFTSGVAPWHFHWGVSSPRRPVWIYWKEEVGGVVAASRKGQRRSCEDVNWIILYEQVQLLAQLSY